MSVTALEYVEAPPTTPLPFGLLSTAQVIDHPEDDRHWRWGVQWEPDGCATVGDAEGVCATATGLTADPNGTTGVVLAPAAGSLLPSGDYTVDWGSGSPEVVTGDDLNDGGKSHTYGGTGTYTITVSGPGGYQSTVTVNTASNPVVPASSVTSYVTQDGIDIITGDPFVLYAQLRCRLVSGERLTARVREAMRLRAPYALEVVTGRRLEAATSTLMPGGTLHPIEALASLENYAGSVYGGVPVIHMSRGLALTLFSQGALIRNSGRLETGTGAYVAAGAGYHTLRRGGAAPAADTAVMYATGAVRVDRPVQPDIIGPLIGSDSGDRTNDVTVRGQAEHVVSWECFTAAAVASTPYTEPAS